MRSFTQPDQHRPRPFTRAPYLGLAKHDLERDSGFSDASSEYLSAVDLTDSEDAGRSGSLVGQDPSGQQVAVMGGSYAGLSPMIIMNNFVLKQPPTMVPTEKQWAFPSPLEVMPQSQVVLLQPMASNGSGGSLKTGSENVRQSKSLKPIRKSYPRIAPHPVDAPARAGPSRVRTGAASDRDQRQRRHHHGHRPYGSPSPRPPPQAAAKPFSVAEAAAASQAGESGEQLAEKSLYALASSPSPYTDQFRTATDSGRMPGDTEPDADPLHSDKQKRFSNTYNILDKSGLLGITMRTKQLIKENKRTQGLLQELQGQTALLLEALGSGDPRLWTKLQLSLRDTEKEQWAAKPPGALA